MEYCVKCSGPVWDNREKKASGQFKPNAPDFSCKDKACGWNSGFGPKASPGQATTPATRPEAPQPQSAPSSRDTLLIELYWDSFDRVMAGLKQRSVSTGFNGQEIAACVATLYIQRARG